MGAVEWKLVWPMWMASEIVGDAADGMDVNVGGDIR